MGLGARQLSEASLRPSAHLDTFTRDNLPAAHLWPVLTTEFFECQYAERLNCAVELLDKAVSEGFGGKAALVAGDEVWSYARLARSSNRIARVLIEDLGVIPGNRVLLRAPNTPMLFAAWFAVLKAGGVVVATMPLLRAHELAQILEKANIQLALCDARLVEELETAQGVKPGLSRIVRFGGPSEELEALCAAKPSELTAVDTAQDDVCLLAFTSGTTGVPKATAHFHRDVLAMCDTFSRHVLKPEKDEIFSGTPPLAFTYGLGALLAFPFRARCTTALPDNASPMALLRAVERHRVTTLFTSPTGYRAMLGLMGESPLTGLRKCISAGEPLSAHTSDAWYRATGVRPIDGIGSTEMMHIFISASGEAIRPGATGKPVPGYQASLWDAQHRPIEGPGVGYLAVRGPTGCRYLADARQAQYVVNGWNVTNDIYRRDAEGYYWFVSRADDMIVSSGYNIAGIEVEQVLLTHPQVSECAVVGTPDSERGHRVHAFVVLKMGTEPSEMLKQSLQDFVKARIAPYKYPRRVTFLEALPRNSTGKVQRFVLRKHEESSAPPLESNVRDPR